MADLEGFGILLVLSALVLATIIFIRGPMLVLKFRAELARLQISAKLMALSMSYGMVFGVCPLCIPMVSTLCTITSSRLAGLSMSATMVGVQLANPLYLALLVPFIKAGEWLCGVAPVNLHIVMNALSSNVWEALHLFGKMFLMALVPWALSCPIIFAVAYSVFHPLCTAIEGKRTQVHDVEDSATPYMLCN